MSSIADRGNNRAQQRAHNLVARRLMLMLGKAGVPEDIFDVKDSDIALMIAPRWSKCDRNGQMIADYLSTKHLVWARRGTYVVIEGGGVFDNSGRDALVNYCLFKAILANFNEVVINGEQADAAVGGVTRSFLLDVGKSVDFISNMPFLTNFRGDERYTILDEWSKIPILAIREIDPNRAPRANTDAVPILDSILRRRRLSGKPTILSFIGSTGDVAKGAERGNTSHGVELANIADASHNEKNGIIRILLGGDGNAEKK